MEIPEWSKQCEKTTVRRKSLLSLSDRATEKTFSYLDPLSLLELRAACRQTKNHVENYDGWSYTLIESFLPNLHIIQPYYREALDSADLLKPSSPQVIQLSAIKNKRHHLWFSYFNSAIYLISDCLVGCELREPMQLLSKNLLGELKSRHF